MISADAILCHVERGCESFLDIAGAISQYSASPKEDLKELYRRLIFSIAINNNR